MCVTPSGSKTFYYWRETSTRRIALGRYPRLSVDAARASAIKRAERTFPFTELALKRLVPDDETYYAWDTVEPRLCLCVTANGAKTFYYRRKIAGRSERIKLGRLTDLSVKVARDRAGEKAGCIGSGENPADERRAMTRESTLAQLWDRYLMLHARPHKKPSSVALDEWLWSHYLEPWGAARKLSSLRKADVQSQLADIAEKHGKTAANNALSLLRHMLNKAMEWGWRAPGGNPAAGVRRFKVASRERYLAADEVKRLLTVLRTEPDARARDYVLVLLLTGARRRNVAAMTWSELDLGSAVWHASDTKGGPQAIALVPAVVGILKARRAAHDALAASVKARTERGTEPTSKRQAARWRLEAVLARNGERHVFPSDSSVGWWTEPRKAWTRILGRAGISGARIHDLRRTAATWAAALGTSVAVLQKALGHRDLDSTMVYTRIPLDPVREAMEKTAAAMWAAAGLAEGAEVLPITIAREGGAS